MVHAFFCTAGSNCNLGGGTPPTIVPAEGGAYAALSSGLFTYSQTDLALPGPMPITISRTYRSQDQDSSGHYIARDFGLGTVLNYSIFLYSNSEVTNGTYTDAEVVMPNGAEIKCQNQSGNISDYMQANFLCKYQPTGIWFGATMTWNSASSEWDLKRKDGTVYAFGRGAPLQSITDRYNNSVTITRNINLSPTCTNPGTQIVSLINGVSTGRHVDLCYDSAKNPTGISAAIDNSGREIDYTYADNFKALTTVTYSSYNHAAQTSYGWNGGTGQLVTITVPLGVNDTVDIDYYSNKRLKQIYKIVTLSPFTVTGPKYAYTTNGQGRIIQCTVTIPKGSSIPGSNSQRSLTFDTNGYLTSDTRAYGSSLAETTSYTRDPVTELVTSITDPVGRITNFVYDGNNSDITLANLTSVTEAAGTSQASTTALAWDVSTNPVFDEISSITGPLNHTWTFGIDSGTGNITSVTEPAPIGNTSSATYNTAGQITSWKDPLDPATLIGYASPSGDLTSITDPLGNTTTFARDSVGRVTSVTTPLRETASFTYDAMDHVLSSTDPNGNVTAYAYDLMGHLTKLTDPLNHATTWDWTPPSAGIWDIKQCDPASKCIEANVDWLTGLPIWVKDKRGLKTTFTYDALQRVTDLAFNSNNVAGYNRSSIAYSYDAADRVIQMVDSGGSNPNTQLIGYDLLDNIASQQAPEGTVTYQYDLASRPQSMTAPNQAAVNYTYDNADRLTNVSNGTLAPSISYDAAGRRTCLTLPNGVIASYGYDSDSRVTSIAYGTGGNCSSPPNNLGTLTYSYDADGRIVGKGGSLAAVNLPPALSSATYSNTNQVTAWGGVNAARDAANNLTLDPSNSAPYAWDERNHLVSVSSPDYSFLYDAFGRRESFDDFGVTTSYLYASLLAAETSSNTQPSSSQYFLTTPGGEVLAYAATSGSATSTLVPLTDVLGSTLGLVNSSGSLATQYSYEPFGVPTLSGQVSNYPYLFAGMEFDAATGLYHTPARYYSPRLQRFLSEDPLQFGGGDINLFAYVGNDPVNMVDPLGLQEVAGSDVNGAAEVGAIDVGVTGNYLALQTGNSGMDPFGVGISGFGGSSSGAATGAGGGVRPTAATTLASMGISSGEIVLAEYTVKLPPGTDPEDAEMALTSVAGPDVELSEGASLILKAMDRPAWAETAGGFVNWLKQLGERLRSAKSALTPSQADAIVGEADRLGIGVRQDTAHAGTRWNMPHLNIGKRGQAHVPLPDGYKPTKSLP